MSIPTLVVMKDGAVYKSSSGIRSPRLPSWLCWTAKAALRLKHLSDLCRQVFILLGRMCYTGTQNF